MPGENFTLVLNAFPLRHLIKIDRPKNKGQYGKRRKLCLAIDSIGPGRVKAVIEQIATRIAVD